ncbi:tetratricopeptide repeat protein [Nostoc sp. FACHB-133]|uniref:tetratricopeptide repeat protein n=1 Tax=Nostoc sp. FACHB-133 TaxID=2692835 RepID=UPI001684F474|nr:tetratricopeptide repeat protein [Nostoc sp. FACHB-133]MBD2525353.1 tetratricopeptide repeat protein [Nostoc sp. FACHB-133]
MKIKNRVGLAFSLVLLSASITTAQAKSTDLPNPTISTQQQDQLEKLQQEKEIRDRVQSEVDRAFGHSTTLLNILLIVLTFLPILAAAGVWLLRRSVVSELVTETKQQLETEVKTQLEKEVAAEVKKQTEDFKQELEILKSDFLGQLSQLNNLFLDAQNQKELILQQLSGLTPSPSLTQDYVHPEIQQKIQELTTQLEILKAGNTHLFFTANDYLKQGDALFFEGRYEDSLACYEQVIQREPNSFLAWINHGWALRRLGRYPKALLSYQKAIAIQSDNYIAWFGCGNSLRKLQRHDEAIASYERALELQPEFHWAWCHKARCHALKNDRDLAIESLTQAIKLRGDQHRELAKNNSDFDLIRADERFKKILAG